MDQAEGTLDGDEIRDLIADIQALDPTQRRKRLDDLENAGRIRPAMKEALAGLCGSSSVSRELKVGAEFGRYTLTKLVGEGGMGQVYEAWDPRMKRNVALKLIRPDLLGVTALMDSEGLASPEERFESEADVLGSLQHAGIVGVFDRGIAEGPGGARIPFCAMEMVEGETLDVYCQQRQPPLEERFRLLIALCDAVGYAHSRTVVHRDLKPANILVDRQGQPRVLDFGLAVAIGRSNPIDLNFLGLGTPAFFAPEQVSHEFGKVSYPTDVYALGLISFHLLTGRMPYRITSRDFESVRHTVTESRPPMLGDIDANLRGDAEQIVHRCLQKNSEARYAHAGALADVLRTCLDKRRMEQLAREVVAQSHSSATPPPAAATPNLEQTLPAMPSSPTADVPGGDKAGSAGVEADKTQLFVREDTATAPSPAQSAAASSAPPATTANDPAASSRPPSAARGESAAHASQSASAAPPRDSSQAAAEAPAQSTDTTTPLDPSSGLGHSATMDDDTTGTTIILPDHLISPPEQRPRHKPLADLRTVTYVVGSAILIVGAILLLPTIFDFSNGEGDGVEIAAIPPRSTAPNEPGNQARPGGSDGNGNLGGKQHPASTASTPQTRPGPDSAAAPGSNGNQDSKPQPTQVSRPPAGTTSPPAPKPTPVSTPPPAPKPEPQPQPQPPPTKPSPPADKAEVDRLFQIAADHLNNDRHEEAIAAFDRVLAADPTHLNAYLNKGNTYKFMNQYDKAIEVYTEGIKVSPETSKFYNYRAQTNWQLDRNEAAVADASEFIRLEPDNSIGYEFRARALIDLNKPEQALEDLNKGLSLNPNDRDLYLYRSKAYEALGRTEEAQRDMNTARGGG